MKKNIVILGAVILIFILYFFLKGDDLLKIRINNEVILAEVADTAEKRKTGLMNRDDLEDGSGMLFIFNDDTVPNFWMKNTLIPLDMIFISADKTINHIEKNVPPCPPETDCPNYSSPYTTQYVLEVPGGYCERKNFKNGDLVEF